LSYPAIKVRNLSKEYVLGGEVDQQKNFREMLTGLAKEPLRRLRKLQGSSGQQEKFWALQDISFEVQPGEVLGIIGRNGAGKSTLLKVLSRITAPTRGEINYRGRLASLLEVGTGFHPELSGRENIFVNGAILGMSKAEIRNKFDEIVDFAGIGIFLDTPVKRYSSGMYVRLAFAVAAHLDPDILVIDEVLAVGDAEFQKKCLGKLQEVAGHGRTVLFVSHNLGAVARLCNRAILLENGKCIMDASVDETVNTYLSSTDSGINAKRFSVNTNKDVQLLAVSLGDTNTESHSGFHNESFSLEVDWQVRCWPKGTYVCLDILNDYGQCVIWSCDISSAAEMKKDRKPGVYRSKVTIPGNVLSPGRYYFTLAVYSPETGKVYDVAERTVSKNILDGGSLFATLGIHKKVLTSVQLEWDVEQIEENPQ
jgi:lipopolysaccharide transport system ATP-binding protein